MALGSNRKRFIYKNLIVIALFNEGNFKGVAWSGKNKVFEVQGQDGIDDSIKKIKSLIDKNPDRVKRAVSEQHKEFLLSKGLGQSNYAGIRSVEKQKLHRSSHCWACHHPVDNSIQFECLKCGWIICFCGACGCSYKMA